MMNCIKYYGSKFLMIMIAEYLKFKFFRFIKQSHKMKTKAKQVQTK